MNEIRINVRDAVIRLIQGDITTMMADAIVNAANASLMGGGGVDGAIHRAGGPAILEECKAIIREIGQCRTGQAVITGGGRLPARHVIHTVGPVWHGGSHGEPELLAKAYRESISLASRRGLSSVAFPSISTGAYGYPLREAAKVALGTVAAFLAGDTPVREVTFVLFGDKAFEAYAEAATIMSTPPDATHGAPAKGVDRSIGT